MQSRSMCKKAVYVRKTRTTCTKNELYTYKKAARRAQNPYTNVRKIHMRTQSYIHLRKQSADVLSKSRSRLKRHGTQQKIKVPTK